MTTSIRFSAAAVLLALAAALPAHAQGEDASSLFDQISWQEGPVAARLGSESEVKVPEGCRFTDAAGTRTFLVATQNKPGGNELGTLLCAGDGEEDASWFVVFSYDDSGYVRDDDSRELDADAILEALREGNEVANEWRQSHGWAPLTITGWVREPFYDPNTNNLTWSTQAESEGNASVNHSVRLLGRGGVMHADLVVDPTDLAAAVPDFDRVVASHAFLPGRKYSEWREGDKLASYGLTALVAGGAGAVAVKSGLLPKLIKFLVVAAVGALAWLKSLFSGKKREAARAGRAE